MEDGDAIGLGESMVLASVDDQLGSGPFVNVVRWAEPGLTICEHIWNTTQERWSTNFLAVRQTPDAASGTHEEEFISRVPVILRIEDLGAQ